MTNSDPNSAPQEKRKRGAPKGNLNALKTGFYSKRFRKEEMHDLVKDPGISLRSEAALLRVVMRRAVELTMNSQDPKDAIALLRAVTDGSNGVSQLLKAEMVVGEHPLDTLDDLINAGLKKVRAELDLPEQQDYNPYGTYDDIIWTDVKPGTWLEGVKAIDLDMELRVCFYHWLYSQEPQTITRLRQARREKQKGLTNSVYTVEGINDQL
jgi:hypothetical protein